MSSTDGSSSIGIRARIIGGAPKEETDLLPSSLLAAVFALLTAGAAFRYFRRRPGDQAAKRPAVLLVTGIGSIFTSIAFIIHAAYSNTNPAKWSSAGFILTEACFVIGEAAYIDAGITLTRDLIIFTLQLGTPHIIFTLAARVVLLVALVLDIAAFAQLPSSGPFDVAQTGSPAGLRLAAAMLVFLLVAFNILVLAGHGIFHSPRPAAFAILLCINAFVIPAALYCFVIVAVTNDNSPLIANNNIFFYLAFGLFQGLHALLLISIDLETYFRAASSRYLRLAL